MKRTAKTLLLTAAIVLFAGADGPKDANKPVAEEREEAVESPSPPPMTRDAAIRRLKAADYSVHEAAPWPGLYVQNGSGPKSKKHCPSWKGFRTC